MNLKSETYFPTIEGDGKSTAFCYENAHNVLFFYTILRALIESTLCMHCHGPNILLIQG